MKRPGAFLVNFYLVLLLFIFYFKHDYIEITVIGTGADDIRRLHILRRYYSSANASSCSNFGPLVPRT